MKKLVVSAILLGGLVSAALASTPSLRDRLAGTYFWAVPGSTWRLQLAGSGGYSIIQEAGLNQPSETIESGTWQFEGFTLVLNSKKTAVGGDHGYRQLHVLQKKASGQLMLVSSVRSESYYGQPFGSDILFDYVFVPTEPKNREKKEETN